MWVRMWSPSGRSPAPPLPSAAGRRAPAPSPGEAPATPMADPGLPLGPGPWVVGAGRWVLGAHTPGRWGLVLGSWALGRGRWTPGSHGSGLDCSRITWIYGARGARLLRYRGSQG